MDEFTGAYRRLAALGEILSGEKVTQRSLAARLGVSLGLMNGILRDMEKDGWVKVDPLPGGAAQYAVTAAGRRAMTKVAREFAEHASEVLQKTCPDKRLPYEPTETLPRKGALRRPSGQARGARG
jgi:DNA-binding MarR family transcriptional regulator